MKLFNLLIVTFYVLVANPFIIYAQTFFDCTNSPLCAPIFIYGTPGFILPDSTLSVTRGMADADIIYDSDSNKLYLTYTFITSNVTLTGNPNIFIKDPSASIHLATSIDSGQTWNFEKILKQSASETNPTTGLNGFSGYEVSSIIKGDGNWYFAYLRFHDPVGNGNNRVNSSFYIGLTKSTSIFDLDMSSEVKLAGNFADVFWLDYNISTLATECSECDLWLDPELFFKDGNLYLLATCEPYENGIRLTDSTFYGVFEISLNTGTFGQPSWVGKIAVANDAVVFGGDELSKADLVYASDGSLLLLVAPVFQGSLFEEYPGAYVFNASFEQNPDIYRDSNSIPIVSAIITSSDSEPTSGSAAYNAMSSTGIIVTRREMYPFQQRLEWSLHQTGVHPQSVVSVRNGIENTIPRFFSLLQNYPNPFNPSTKIQYSIPKDGAVHINLFDILGKKIKTLVDENQSTGNYEIEFDATNLTSGVYFYKITCANYSKTKKMLLIK